MYNELETGKTKFVKLDTHDHQFSLIKENSADMCLFTLEKS